MKSQANRLWQLRNAGAGMVCLADRQAEGVSWWGNGLWKTLAGGCTIEGNLNFGANTRVSLLGSIAVGITHTFLSLFNLESPAMQIGEDVFICSGKCTGPRVFGSVAVQSTEQAAGAVQGDLQALQSRLWCGLCSQEHLCVLKTCLHTSRRRAMLFQAPAD